MRPYLLVLLWHGATAMHLPDMHLRSAVHLPAMHLRSTVPTMSATATGGPGGNDNPSSSDGQLEQLERSIKYDDGRASISERERKRFEYLIKTHEPIPQEIIGLQAIFGCIGSQCAGFCGLIIGVMQLAPILSMVPGRSGNLLRGSGWHVFWFARVGWVRLAYVYTALSKQIRSWLRETRRWNEATGTSATVRRAVSSSRRAVQRRRTRRELFRTLSLQLQITRFVPHQRPRGPNHGPSLDAGPGAGPVPDEEAP